ncbi:M20/M25/M40 family metallo-hydrolase [Nocardia sp. NPDC004123]
MGDQFESGAVADGSVLFSDSPSRQLDPIDSPLALASSIWPHGRWAFCFTGEANHAGATRCWLSYPLFIARTSAEKLGAVATFGKVLVAPNGTNAIPSEVNAWLDARAANEETLEALVAEIKDLAHRHAVRDGVSLQAVTESRSPIVEFPYETRERLRAELAHLGNIPVLPTAAGHDAGVLSEQVSTAVLFVRNPTGISHSAPEYAEPDDCRRGAVALADVMAAWV